MAELACIALVTQPKYLPKSDALKCNERFDPPPVTPPQNYATFCALHRGGVRVFTPPLAPGLLRRWINTLTTAPLPRSCLRLPSSHYYIHT